MKNKVNRASDSLAGTVLAVLLVAALVLSQTPAGFAYASALGLADAPAHAQGAEAADAAEGGALGGEVEDAAAALGVRQNWPSRLHPQRHGSTTSAYCVDRVGYTSLTTMNVSKMPLLSAPSPRKRVRFGMDCAQLLWADHMKSMLPLETLAEHLHRVHAGSLDLVEVALRVDPEIASV